MGIALMEEELTMLNSMLKLKLEQQGEKLQRALLELSNFT
jgi:hypothetical protein